MALIVQKYGGTSVGSLERMQNVAARALRPGGRAAAIFPTERATELLKTLGAAVRPAGRRRRGLSRSELQ